jgi:hypothetical protein
MRNQARKPSIGTLIALSLNPEQTVFIAPTRDAYHDNPIE